MSGKAGLYLAMARGADSIKWDIDIPNDDQWHEAHIVLQVRRSKDAGTIWIGNNPPLVAFIDGKSL